ncbi:hypothetical protein GQX73_g1514 [Xylaria multiplex]|uniref:Uncharacterized protein n=1 Tax=Xylaria multiplex TaxID=323545 RepID=A0A7C8MZ62_9PEZI|nr:hypothetical protein GQX73_g1514 [Xylaria multiplex]
MASFGLGGASNFLDRSTGQMGRQWHVPVPSAMPKPWNRVSRSCVNHHQCKPSRLGVESLVDICTRIAIQNIDRLDQAHLQDLPIRLVGRIWRDVKSLETPSLETWKLFATRITKDQEMEHYICPLLMNYSASTPKTQPLAAYIVPLISNTFDFLTHLTITGQAYGRTCELLQLVQLKNLAVLEIIDLENHDECVFPQLTDSVLREWSTTPNPFPLLRILRIWGNDHTTRHSLRYIQAFPCLVLYDVAGRKRDWIGKGEESVWESTKKTWTKYLEDNIRRHFHLAETGGVYDRQKPKAHAGTDTTIPQIRPIPSRRDDKKKHRGLKEFEDSHNRRDVFVGWRSLEQLGYSSHYGLSEFPSNEGLWGFLMYCYIGKLLSDQDLQTQGLEIGERALDLGAFILPPRPMVNLVLGETSSDLPRPMGEERPWDEYDHNRVLSIGKNFETQLTFVRRRHHEGKCEASASAFISSETAKRPLDTSNISHIPLKKRRDVTSLLASFN